MWTSAALTVAIATAAATTVTPTATVSAGTLQGGTCTNNSEAVYFKSIPFAQPPVNSLRFAAPQPFTEAYKDGSRNATQPAPACIQFGSLLSEEGNTSEDCLYLDIWTPANATNTSALPVRAWVFGGSNTAGGISDPLFDGCNVPQTGAIMVSISYRLGPLGFLALREAGIGGNMAVQDIILALQWIQDNIDAFGGDNKKVMLHGQSSGALDSFVVATLPQASELFSSVILESGGGRDQPLLERGEELGQAYAQALNCSVSDSACLRSVPVPALQSIFNTLPLLNEASLPALGVNTIDDFSFEPYVDGRIIPAQPSRKGVNVPAIFGSNSQDGLLFSLAQFTTSPESATAQNYTTFLNENFGYRATSLIEQYYPLSAFNASPFPAFTAMGTVLTDASYLCTAYRGAKTAAAKGVPAWLYLFAHSLKCPWISSVPADALPLIGATHTCEIPFMLGNTANLPQPDGNCTMSAAEQALSRFMASAWTRFAATQQPTSDTAQWPALNDSNLTVAMIFNDTASAGLIDYSPCQLWDQVYAAEVQAANNGSYEGVGTADMNNVTQVSTLPSTGAASSARVHTVMTVLSIFTATVILL